MVAVSHGHPVSLFANLLLGVWLRFFWFVRSHEKAHRVNLFLAPPGVSFSYLERTKGSRGHVTLLSVFAELRRNTSGHLISTLIEETFRLLKRLRKKCCQQFLVADEMSERVQEAQEPPTSSSHAISRLHKSWGI